MMGAERRSMVMTDDENALPRIMKPVTLLSALHQPESTQSIKQPLSRVVVRWDGDALA